MFEGLLWGLGFSLGLAFGLLVFIGLFIAIDMLSGRQTDRQKWSEVNERSLRALERRNELTEEMVNSLETIADAVRSYQRN